MSRAPTPREIDYGCVLERRRRENERTARRLVVLVWATVIGLGLLILWGVTR